jgi:hypothetical protein
MDRTSRAHTQLGTEHALKTVVLRVADASLTLNNAPLARPYPNRRGMPLRVPPTSRTVPVLWEYRHRVDMDDAHGTPR